MRSGGPNPPAGLAILRVVVGVTYVAHGAPKLFGGGAEGLAGMLGQLGLPLATVAAWAVTLLEFFGGLALIVGFLVTPIALLLTFHMLVGIVLVHAPNGFYVIGPGQGGVELNLLLIGALMALILAGPGAAALDARTGGGTPARGPGSAAREPGTGTGGPETAAGGGSPGSEPPAGRRVDR